MGQRVKSCIVLKVGGSLGGDSGPAVIQAIERITGNGDSVVVVHGGGQRISAALTDAGITSTFVDGQRVTSAEAMEVVERVLAHEVNSEIVGVLRSSGIAAVGLSGADDILYGTPIPRLCRAARVHQVNPTALDAVITGRDVPVVAPVGRDEAGLHYNINADLAAAAIAGALHADKIVFLTDVDGIYADFAAGDLLIDTTDVELQQLMQAGRFVTGMIPKVESVLAALGAGVANAYVVNGRDVSAVLWAVGAEAQGAGEPLGTWITQSDSNVYV